MKLFIAFLIAAVFISCGSNQNFSKSNLKAEPPKVIEINGRMFDLNYALLETEDLKNFILIWDDGEEFRFSTSELNKTEQKLVIDKWLEDAKQELKGQRFVIEIGFRVFPVECGYFLTDDYNYFELVWDDGESFYFKRKDVDEDTYKAILIRMVEENSYLKS